MHKSFKQIEELVLEMSKLAGDAQHAFRESIVGDMQENGYSPGRAEQVINMAHERKLKRPT